MLPILLAHSYTHPFSMESTQAWLSGSSICRIQSKRVSTSAIKCLGSIKPSVHVPFLSVGQSVLYEQYSVSFTITAFWCQSSDGEAPPYACTSWIYKTSHSTPNMPGCPPRLRPLISLCHSCSNLNPVVSFLIVNTCYPAHVMCSFKCVPKVSRSGEWKKRRLVMFSLHG